MAKSVTATDILKNEHNEDLLKDNPQRWVLLPIQFQSVWETYKKLEESFWTPEDTSFIDDKTKAGFISADVRKKLLLLSAFNAISYNKVYNVDTVSVNHLCIIQSPEARAYYGFQIAFEMFHIEIFNLAFEALLEGAEPAALCEHVYNLPSVVAKKEWCYRHLQHDTPDEKPYVQKMMAVAISKWIFNSANTLIRNWMVEQKIDLPGFVDGHRAVAKDLMIHIEMCSVLYNQLTKLPREDVAVMINEAVDIEIGFLMEFLPMEAMNLTEGALQEFLVWMADELLAEMKYDKLSDMRQCPINYVDLSMDRTIKKEKTVERQTVVVDNDLWKNLSNDNKVDVANVGFCIDEDF